MAAILARRGITSGCEADAFLAAGETHDPLQFDGMTEAVGLVLDAIRSGDNVTVYGDFDCDGVCATSILVAAIRELGGRCDWFIPDRISEGYGLNADAIRSIAERGTSLVITVDCGVTAVEEVALARELGMEIVITDHHQPGPELPDCLILHPQVSRYPFPSLCGAAVAAKLASASRREAGIGSGRDEKDLDLVALATVTDVMPLTGENRHLVREGVKVARRAGRVGLAALAAEAKVGFSDLSSEDFGFRLGPRINAAGRMYRADAGVELFLADSPERASEIARELSAANSERRRVEAEVESAAKAALREQDETGAGLVVAGEGWHQGVVGIVASKLVRAEGRPAVVIALDGETGRGSARSVPGLDLHAALGGVADLLEGYGGHAAAAGLSIRTDRIDEFRRAFGSEVEALIGGDPAEPVLEVDAVAGGADLGLDLAEEIEKLQPFGSGNPAVKLLVPGAGIEDLQEMGEGRHCRFTVRSGSHRARGVCFGRTSFDLEDDQRVDVVAELGVNRWNGSIEPRLRVEAVLPVAATEPLQSCAESEWWERFEQSLAAPEEESGSRGGAELELASAPEGLPGVAVAELISSGERLVILTADARQRWMGLGGTALSRFLPEPALVTGLWPGSPRDEVAKARETQVLLTDFPSLTGPGGARFTGLGEFDRIALLDPPYTADAIGLLAGSGLPVHLLSGPDEFAFTALVAAHRLDLTAQLRALFRGFREAGAIDGSQLSGGDLRTLLELDGQRLRSPEESACLLRILIETDLARTGGVGSARHAGVVSSKRTDLSASAVFARHLRLHKEIDRFLNHFNRQTQKL